MIFSSMKVKSTISMNTSTCILLLAFSITLIRCNGGSETEKYHTGRNNVIQVQDQIKEIEFEDAYLSNFARIYTMEDYLIVSDYHSFDKLIYIFDRNDFSFIANIAPKGQGPGEISNMGHIGIDEKNHIFYVSDHGKQKIFSYHLDSVLANPSYKAVEKLNLNELQFPNKYILLNDSLCIGQIIEPTGNYGFNQSLAKWNISTGEITPMKYTHPKIERKRVCFAVSEENGIYVECYQHHDLVTICDLNGNLKQNIYGRKWDNKTSNRQQYFDDVIIYNKRILASYSDGKERGPTTADRPTQILVFDLTGNYIKTLDIGYRIMGICYDDQNNRLLMHLDDMIQFGYLTLNDQLLNK